MEETQVSFWTPQARAFINFMGGVPDDVHSPGAAAILRTLNNENEPPAVELDPNDLLAIEEAAAQPVLRLNMPPLLLSDSVSETFRLDSVKPTSASAWRTSAARIAVIAASIAIGFGASEVRHHAVVPAHASALAMAQAYRPTLPAPIVTPLEFVTVAGACPTTVVAAVPTKNKKKRKRKTNTASRGTILDQSTEQMVDATSVKLYDIYE